MIGFQVGVYIGAGEVLDLGDSIRRKMIKDIKAKPTTEILDPVWLTCQHT